MPEKDYLTLQDAVDAAKEYGIPLDKIELGVGIDVARAAEGKHVTVSSVTGLFIPHDRTDKLEVSPNGLPLIVLVASMAEVADEQRN